MVKFRNRLVHLYWEVDKKEVYETIKNNLADIEEFIKYVTEYLEKGKSKQ